MNSFKNTCNGWKEKGCDYVAALPLSFAGVVDSKKNNKKCLIPGTVGLILSVVEVILVVFSIVAYLSIEAKAPDHILDSIPPHTGTSAGIETSEPMDWMNVTEKEQTTGI